MNKSENKKTKPLGGKAIIVIGALLICAAVIVVSGFVGESGVSQWARGLLVSDGEVKDGSLDIDGIDEINDVPEGEVRFYINKAVKFDNAYAKGNIMIQNPEKSQYILEFRFYINGESSNVPFYTSDKIKPGQYLSGDKLDTVLDEGEYECSYIARAYSIEYPDEFVGETSGYLTVSILN